MTIIKGPIKLTGGFNAKEFMAEHADDIKIALPFKATGWKSTKTPKIADMSGIELAEDKPARKKKVSRKKK
jgi:hypothetical protein